MAQCAALITPYAAKSLEPFPLSLHNEFIAHRAFLSRLPFARDANSMSSLAHRRASSGDILKAERGVASCGSGSHPLPREVRKAASRALRPGCEELAPIRTQVRWGSAAPEPKIATVRAPRRRASRVMGRKAPRKRLACRVKCRPNGCLASTRTTLGAPPPFDRGARSEKAKPGRRKRAAGTRTAVWNGEI